MKRSYVTLSLAVLVVAASWALFTLYRKKEVTAPVVTENVTLKVVNVLSPELYNDAHIKGSINIDYAELMEKTKDWNKETPIVLYCANYACLASSEGARELTKQGFTHAMAFEGGMAEWHQLGQTDASYATEGTAQQAYLTVPSQKPAQEHEDIHVVTAAELKAMMIEAGLLP